MNSIFNRTERRPQRIESDHGLEFYNKHFAKLCQKLNIHHFSSQSSHKASVVERFNRSLKELMYKHFSAFNTYEWIDVLPDLIKTYNSRHHRSIGRSPNSVTSENEAEVYRHLYPRRKPKWGKRLNPGDLVRISRKRHIFEKGYLPQFTEEVFKISRRIDNHRPYRYELEDMAGEDIEGRFASEEIQKIIKADDEIWKIEKIIRKIDRHGEQLYLVKWRGFPDKFNSYVRAEDIIHLPTSIELGRPASPAPSEEF